MWGHTLAFLAAGYVLGSFPTAYVLARWLKGIDIRQYGTGNVGGTNVGVQLGVWATVVVGLVDIAKGAIPPLVAQSFSLDPLAAAAGGIGAVIGHNWSCALGFRGGRGMAATLGCLAVMAPWAALAILLSLLIGRIVRLTALVNGIGVALLPLAALALNQPAAVFFLCLAIVIVVAVKRLLANGEPYPAGVSPARARLNRLLYDRDVGPRESWGERKPRLL